MQEVARVGRNAVENGYDGVIVERDRAPSTPCQRLNTIFRATPVIVPKFTTQSVIAADYRSAKFGSGFLRCRR